MRRSIPIVIDMLTPAVKSHEEIINVETKNKIGHFVALETTTFICSDFIFENHDGLATQ